MTTPWIVAFAVLWLIVLLTLVVVTGVVRRSISVIEELGSAPADLAFGAEYGGIEPGTLEPDFAASDRAGRLLSRDDLGGEAHVVAFLSSACPPCARLANELHRASDVRDLGLVVVLEDTDAARAIPFPEGVTVLHQHGRAVSEAFESRVTPHAFAVSPDGVVRSVAIPDGVSTLRQLLERAREGGGVREGAPVPV